MVRGSNRVADFNAAYSTFFATMIAQFFNSFSNNSVGKQLVIAVNFNCYLEMPNFRDTFSHAIEFLFPQSIRDLTTGEFIHITSRSYSADILDANGKVEGVLTVMKEKAVVRVDIIEEDFVDPLEEQIRHVYSYIHRSRGVVLMHYP